MIDLAYIRQFRIGPYSIFDFAVSYLGVYFLAPLFSKACSKIHLNISRSGWMWLTLPLSVVFHLIFRQQTAFMKGLISPQHYFIEAIVLLFMLYMGLKDVRKPLV
jgi:hypothetical protein